MCVCYFPVPPSACTAQHRDWWLQAYAVRYRKALSSCAQRTNSSLTFFFCRNRTTWQSTRKYHGTAFIKAGFPFEQTAFVECAGDVPSSVWKRALHSSAARLLFGLVAYWIFLHLYYVYFGTIRLVLKHTIYFVFRLDSLNTQTYVSSKLSSDIVHNNNNTHASTSSGSIS